MAFRRIKDWTKKAGKSITDAADHAKNKAMDALEEQSLQERFNEAGTKMTKTAKDIVNTSPKEHFKKMRENAAEGKRALTELRQNLKSMEKEEAAEFLMDTYKGLTKAEAVKLAAAVIVPGGIPIWAAMKLNEFRQKKKAEASTNADMQSIKAANENKSAPKPAKKGIKKPKFNHFDKR